jgi:ABC-type transport system involved in cytochrome c biogenesis permease component
MWIPVVVFIGGILAPILGWARAYLNTKHDASLVQNTTIEKLDIKRIYASAVISCIAAFIFLGQYSSAISVGLPDLELAFIAGFGADKIVKNSIGI